MEKILRVETLFGTVTKVQDASHIAKEKTINNIKVFKIKSVLNDNNIFIGFGRPNVFIAIPSEEGYKKVDAKSIKRKKTSIIDTRGFVQSGLIFSIDHSTDDMLNRINIAAQSFVGSKHWTCVNANCRILNRAGFTSGHKDLSSFYFPMPLARHIIKYGLEYNGKPVQYSIIKTTQNYLENFGLSVIKAQWLTLYRHGRILVQKNKFLNNINNVKHTILNKLFKNKKNNKVGKIEDVVTNFPENIKSGSFFELTVSKPRKMGLLGRFIWGPHVFFEINQDKEIINNALPNKLTAYKAKEKNIFNFIKKNILFSKPVISFIRSILIKDRELIPNCSEKELYNMIRTNSNTKPHKYNLVITDTQISVIKIDIKYKAIDWILSKHVLLSGYSNEVRFAGEFWKDPNGNIYFNNNSGTYAPCNNTLSEVDVLLKNIFPNINIISIPFE